MARLEKNSLVRLPGRIRKEGTSPKTVKWEGMWLQERRIHEGKRGFHAKTFSWANDEGIQMAVREWCATQGDSMYDKFLGASASNKRRIVLTYSLEKLRDMI
jgi:hypothetical protein